LKGAGVCAVPKIQLNHVLQFDNGVNDSESFMTDCGYDLEVRRLTGDLLLLTRPYGGDVKIGVDFSEVERLINEAAPIISKRIAMMRGKLGVLDVPGGLKWWAWGRAKKQGIRGLRHPTADEVVHFEGESQILMNALPRANENGPMNLRLLAAWGVYCCERAFGCCVEGSVRSAIEWFCAAGVLLGHANWWLGCLTLDGLAKYKTRQSGKAGGTIAASHWKKVSEMAVGLARQRGFGGGDWSAEAAAAAIKDEVRAFARRNGRDFPGGEPHRKIAEYLRSAGIKKGRRTS